MSREPEFWTEADQAELDVLVWALAGGHAEHRKWCRVCLPEPCPEYEAWIHHEAGCQACQGGAPLAFGPPCERHSAFVKHGQECPRCNPCPHLREATDVVSSWLEARVLLSRAEALRAQLRGASRVNLGAEACRHLRA